MIHVVILEWNIFTVCVIQVRMIWHHFTDKDCKAANCENCFEERGCSRLRISKGASAYIFSMSTHVCIKCCVRAFIGGRTKITQMPRLMIREGLARTSQICARGPRCARIEKKL